MTTTVKAGDTRPLTWRVNADLTGVTAVELHARPADGGAAVTLAATVTDAADGEITHVPDGSLPVGIYLLEAEITGPGARVARAPSNGYEDLVVEEAVA